MSGNFEKNLNKTEEINKTPEVGPAISDAEKLDDSCLEVRSEIDNLSNSAINEGVELLSDFPEIKDSQESKLLNEVNQEIIDLRHESNNSIAWVKERFNLSKMEKENFVDIEIQGSKEFREKIKNSLKFLSLDQKKLNFAQEHISRIQELEHSGMNMFKDRPTFQIGNIWNDGDEIYLASAIAHDAYHSFLCKNSEDNKGNILIDAFSGKEAEKKCLAFQIETLDGIKNSDHMKDHQEIVQGYIDQLKELSIDPTYQDIPYEERNW